MVVNSTNHFTSFTINPNPSYQPPGGMDCITDCIAAAVTACMADAWCTILCGMMIEYCIPEIAIACTYHCATLGTGQNTW